MPRVPLTEIKYRTAFGKNLRRIRRSKKITLMDLEELTSIHYNQIGRIERGEITTSIYNIYIFSKALDVDPKRLVDFEV
jgi:transcriptional regulator with XRE-family HTH domain